MSLIENIKESEGYRASVYKCTEGYDTIGYGFAIKDLKLSEEVSEIILKEKLDKLKEGVDRNFKWVKNMPVKGQDVVYEMCYQLGIVGFSKFKRTISLLQLQDYSGASREMLDSKWAKQTPNRAKKLSEEIYRLES